MLNSTMRSSKEIKAVEASLLMTEEKYSEASIILHELTRSYPQNSKHWLNWSTCLKALKYTVAPKKVLQNAILWHPENIDLQYSFAQSMAEMGKLKSYKQAHSCWSRDFNELSKEHIFSRQFLEISSENMDHKVRQELSKNGKLNNSQVKPYPCGRIIYQSLRKIVRSDWLFICRLAQSSSRALYAPDLEKS